MESAARLISLCALGGFLIGGIPTGVILSLRRYRIDVREIGSGNIGATNVTRVFGVFAGALTLLFDVLKGWLPMVALNWWYPGQEPALLALALGLVMGHCFSPYLKFRGGKGVATSLGVVLALDGWAGLVGVVTYAASLGLSRISAVGSLTALVSVNLYVHFLSPLGRHAQLVIAAISLVVLARHHTNIRKLFSGQYARKKESKI